MFVKIFERGIGKSGGIDYLTGDKDSKGRIRSVVPQLLRGNTETTKALIDTTDYAQRYTSGVLSFEESNLSQNKKQQIMDSFEKKALFPGLDPEQYNTLWIEHRDKGRLEMHFVIPNQELTTGKRLAPYYHRADMPRVDNWQEVTNYDHGLSSPKEPTRRQTITLSRNLPPQKKAAVLEINANIEAMINSGSIDCRDDVVQALRDAGLEIARVTKKSISIKNPEDGKQNIRFKGAYYEQSFESRSQLAGDYEQARASYYSNLRANIDRARKKLAAQVVRKTEYLRNRYRRDFDPTRPKIKKNLSQIRADVERDREQTSANRGIPQPSNPEPEMALVETNRSGAGLRDSDSRGELGGAHIPGHQINGDVDRAESTSSDAGKSASKGKLEHLQGEKVRPDRRERPSFSGWLQDFKNRLGVSYDRVRATTDGWAGKIKRTIRRGHGAAGKADTNVDLACGKIDDCLRRSERNFERGKRVKHNRTDELERFKIDINLVTYAQGLGYEINLKKSCSNSIVMQSANDKIVIATSEQGHGIYFSTSANDSGTIIDFVQSRKLLNLGQVRKELRPYIGVQPQQEQGKATPKPKSSTKDHQTVIHNYSRCISADKHPYLEERGLSPRTLQDPRFKGAWRVDLKGNAIFPHYRNGELVGYELKNKDFTGFAKSGSKAFWQSSNLLDAKKIIVTEGAIDALSHAQINRDRNTGYLSFGGQLSPDQKRQLEKALRWAESTDKKVVVAVDNDKAGDQFYALIKAIAPQATRDLPHGKDFNEDLQEQPSRGMER